MKNVSFWSALDLIKQTAETQELWTGTVDALMDLIIGKSKVTAGYKAWLKDEFLTLETANILKRRGVDYHYDGTAIRFALQDKPAGKELTDE